jgi:uncharacterized protein
MKNFSSKFIIFLLAFILIFSTYVYAIPKPSHEFYVYDKEDLLNNDIENYIIESNLELYQKTGAQIVVVTINDLEGMDINSYATELFDEWDIGGKELDNGLLMLIVPEAKEIWIEVGYGLEGILPDSRVKRIIENSIIPSFSEGDYSSGVLSGYEEILNYVESEYNIELSSREGQYYNGGNANYTGARLPNIFIIIGIIIFIFIDFKFFRGWLTFSLLRGLGRGGNSGGGGRGSKGGGGRSGGGGAGGRW